MICPLDVMGIKHYLFIKVGNIWKHIFMLAVQNCILLHFLYFILNIYFNFLYHFSKL